MIQTININYWSVLAAAVSNIVIGSLWYGPLFGKEWMKMMGVGKQGSNKNKIMPMQAMAFGFIAALVMSYVLAHFVVYAQAVNFVDGMQTGFWIWLGFIATLLIGSVLWEGKPIKLFFLNAAHWLVSLLVMGGILAAWH